MYECGVILRCSACLGELGATHLCPATLDNRESVFSCGESVNQYVMYAHIPLCETPFHGRNPLGTPHLVQDLFERLVVGANPLHCALVQEGHRANSQLTKQCTVSVWVDSKYLFAFNRS